MSSRGEEERRKMIERLEGLEAAGLTAEDMARVFGEEMDKSVENRESVLWLWLSEVSSSTCLSSIILPGIPDRVVLCS